MKSSRNSAPRPWPTSGTSIALAVPHPDGADDVQALLAEQLPYYRARAPEYTETSIPEKRVIAVQATFLRPTDGRKAPLANPTIRK